MRRWPCGWAGPAKAGRAALVRVEALIAAGVLAGGHLRHRLFALLFHLGSGHLGPPREAPRVAERVLQLAVALAPELVLERHRDLRACGHGLAEELVDVLGVDVEVDG